jgi:hypothetical protein
MKLTEAERTSSSKFRNVGDLITQFQCEYRLFLEQQKGQRVGIAAINGSIFHYERSVAGEMRPSVNIWLRIAMILAIVIIGILWIVG